MAEAYERWTVEKIKADLVRRGGATSGRKTDLVERLRSYDRNDDFRSPPVLLPSQVTVDWPTSGFENLLPCHQDRLPDIRKEQLEGYFIYRLAQDNNFVADIKALDKGQRLLEGGRILACSVFRSQLSTFFSGMVGASMKKKVTYNFKLKICSSSGEPINSDCECPAGKGPNATCKHIASVLLMLVHFKETGLVQISKSCTENLQMFHKPKSTYKGRPVKAEDMLSSKGTTSTNLDDPRPPQYRNMDGYNDMVRNHVINYCSHTSDDLAMRYLYPKADIQSAALDHDYLLLPFTEHWVDNSVQVTEEAACGIEKTTRLQRKSVQWRRERKFRLTASHFGSIVHMTDRRNKNKLCSSIYSPPALQSRAICHGIQYEPRALSKFEDISQLKTHKAGLFVSVTHPYLGATPDAIIDSEHIVEVKCPYSGRHSMIAPGKFFPYLSYNSEHTITLKTTSNYYNQVQGQLLVTKRKFCYFVVYTFSDLFVEKIAIDEDYCQYSLVPKLELFYTKYFRPYLALHF